MTLDLAAPAAEMARIAAAIRDDQLNDPTPCPASTCAACSPTSSGLSVGFRDAARKVEGPTTSTPPGPAKLPHDWRAQLPHRLNELVAAWREPGAWEGSQPSVVSRHRPRRRPPSATTSWLFTPGTSPCRLASLTHRPSRPASLLPAGVVDSGRPAGAPRSVRAEGCGSRGRISAGTHASRRRPRPTLAAGLGPDLGVQELFAADQVTGVGTGGEILPAAVGDDQHDVR